MKKKIILLALGLTFAVAISTSVYAEATSNSQVDKKVKCQQRIVENTKLQKLLGMTQTEIQKAISNGKTIGQLLDEKKITHVQLKSIKQDKEKRENRFAENKNVQSLLNMTQAEIEKTLTNGKSFAQLLDEKKITHTQLEKMMPRRMGHSERFANNATVQSLLGMTQAEIEKELDGGKTMGQLLDEKKITHVQLQKSMKNEREKRLAANEDIQKLLGMTEAQIEKEIASGKSFAQLLDEKNVSHVQMEKLKPFKGGGHGKGQHHGNGTRHGSE
ncbi:MAG: hypothetical protein ACI35O_04295 [Bacillaceae bacterium]